MADYFGFDKTAQGPTKVLSTAMAIVTVGGNDVRLAQGVTVTYTRKVEPQFELGSDSVWMVVGHSQGTCKIDRAVGEGKFLEPFQGQGTGCDTTTLTLDTTGNCGSAAGTVKMTGAMLQEVSIQATVQNVTITESANYIFGSLETS